MSEEDLYNSTRCWWKVSPESVRNRRVEHAVAVFEGITRSLYAIDRWSYNSKRDRWGFEGVLVRSGPLFKEVVGAEGHWVPFPPNAQSPIIYWPMVITGQLAQERAHAASTRPVCPIHHLELPLSGQCDLCDG